MTSTGVKSPNSNSQYKMPQDGGANALKWINVHEDEGEGGIFGNKGSKKKHRRNQGLSQSIHLQAMKRTQPSIIPEEYEPYSTGHWSRHNYGNPHAAAIQSSTQSSFINIKKEVEREFNMYQKVEMQKNTVDKFLADKRRLQARDWQQRGSKMSSAMQSSDGLERTGRVSYNGGVGGTARTSGGLPNIDGSAARSGHDYGASNSKNQSDGFEKNAAGRRAWEHQLTRVN